MNLTGPHLLLILVLVLLLFGAAKLPALAKSVGQSARVFKGEMKAMKSDDAAEGTPDVNNSTAADSTSDSASSPPSTTSPPSNRSSAS